MLSEIICEHFCDEGNPRGPICLREGLNVVLGSSGGSNSIGKTSFLLIVDFAFGGSTYAKQEETLRNVGPHSIFFSHRIEGVEHRFMRPAHEPDKVYRCDENYEPIEDIGSGKFLDWLLVSYGLDGLGLSFRNAVSPFMRIYGKGNLDESHPLARVAAEAPKASIARLVDLFGLHGAVAAGEKRVKEAQDEKKAYNGALSRGFVPAPANKGEAKRDAARMNEIAARIAELEASHSRGLVDKDELEIEELTRLKQQCAKLKRKRATLRAQVARIDADELGMSHAQQGDLKELARFFPSCDVKSIEQIEGFHTKLAGILKNERAEERSRICEQIDMVSDEVEAMERRIASFTGIQNLPVATLREYAELSGELKRLEAGNEAYARKAELAEKSKQAKAECSEKYDEVLSSIAERVNPHLAELNEQVAGADSKPPVLAFTPTPSYSLAIDGDAGTGAGVRAMELLDLTLLDLTALPVIACDSPALKQLSDAVLVNLLSVFAARTKQSFVAIDKAESLSLGPLPPVVEEAVVIRLSDGHELFGRSWAKRSKAQ